MLVTLYKLVVILKSRQKKTVFYERMPAHNPNWSMKSDVLILIHEVTGDPSG